MQKGFFKKKTVAVLAAVFFLCIFFEIFASAAFAVTIKGLPPWAEPSAKRSLEAVLSEIPRSIHPNERYSMLLIVAEQIFRGYEVKTVYSAGINEPEIIFIPTGDFSGWTVELMPPQLREPVDAWFNEDIAGLSAEIMTTLNNFPVEALTWADTALKDKIREFVDDMVSGWDFSLLVRIEEGRKVLQISFRPVQPFVLSIAASVKSNALPVMFQSDLSAKLVSDMYAIIGLPVAWVEQHEERISAWAEEKLRDRNAVFNIRASVSAEFTPDQVSRLETRTDSERFFFALRLAAYFGARGRVPELWLTAGWRTAGLTGIPLDIYNETFMALDDFNVNARFGARLEVARGFMIGAEYATQKDAVWYRLWWDDSSRRPYFWWRWNHEFGHNLALGYRLRDDLAIELHYDERDRDFFSVRGIFQF